MSNLGECKDADEERAATEFYVKCRSQIEHEDHLVNHRLTWLMTIQGLLFTAYGFSISAEASSLNAALSLKPGLPQDAYTAFVTHLHLVREALAGLGFFSSVAAWIGVMAADRAIKNVSGELKELPGLSQTKKKLYPPPVGSQITNFLGMVCGLSMPLLTAAGWLWIGNLPDNFRYGAYGFIAILLLFTLHFVFVKASLR